MKILNENVNSFMTLKFDFHGIRIINTFLEPTSFSLYVNITSVIDPKSSAEFSAIQTEGAIAFQKLYFWLEAVLPGIVMIDCGDKLGFNFSAMVGNMMMHCPGEPLDDLLVRMLHSKMVAIVGKKLIIREVKLNGKDSMTSYTFVPNTHGYGLPKTVREYLDLPSVFKTPWWTRSDGFCFEFVKGKNVKEKLSDIYGDITDPLVEFEETLRRGTQEGAQPLAPIIELDKWKPKKL